MNSTTSSTMYKYEVHGRGAAAEPATRVRSVGQQQAYQAQLAPPGRLWASMLAVAVAALAQLVVLRAADEQCEGPGQPDSWPRLWGGVQRGLGAYQPPRHPIADYADYTELSSAAQHFHRRGLALGRDSRHDEALRAFQRASVPPCPCCPEPAALSLCAPALTRGDLRRRSNRLIPRTGTTSAWPCSGRATRRRRWRRWGALCAWTPRIDWPP